MASCVVFFGGCFLCFVLILIQMGFFVAYQVTYVPFTSLLMLGYVLVALAFAALAIAVLFCINSSEEDRDKSRPQWPTLIWVGYVLFGLIPNVIAIWGFAVDAGLEKGTFLGPNLLKGIICITPFVLILLANTKEGDISEQRRERLWHMSLQVMVDLFDVTEMLDAILEAQEQHNAISKELRIAMTAVACFAYLIVTSMQMEETKILEDGQTKARFKTTLTRNVLQMTFVNIPLLIFRLTLESWKNESIFISKNIIAIIYSLWKICKLCTKCISAENYDYSSLPDKLEVDY